jgi:DNA-binding GntR family transcriptional regulator
VTVDTSDPTPPYAQIARHLRQQITSGELRSGEKLPSGRELAKRFGVSTKTVASAIKMLRDAGLLTAQQGRGTFVRDPAASTAPVQGSAEFEQVMGHLLQFQDDLQQMRHRLELLEGAVARLLSEDDGTAR